MYILQILGFVFLVPGFAMVFLARFIVEKYRFHEKVECNFENEMSEEEVIIYKNNKALVNVKMMGMLVALPGFIMIFVAFKP